MKINRGLAGVVALTAVTFAAGCAGADSPAAAPAAPTAAEPRDELLASIPDGKVDAFAFAATSGCAVPVSGVLDAPHQAIRTTISQNLPEVRGSMTMTFLAIGVDKPYLHVSSKPASLATTMGMAKAWVAVDPAKIDDFEESPLTYDGELDPLDAVSLIEAATDVARDDKGFAGAIDLTRVDADGVIEAAAVTKLGAKAKTVPFEATLDPASGHLAKLSVALPSGKPCTLTYSGYGATKALTAPAAKQAPAAVYDMLNS